MRQRFLMCKEGTANNLVIKEYAVIGKDPVKIQGFMQKEDDYTFLCQENYKGADIRLSISKGVDDLITTLRTHNLFPIGTVAVKMAESVIELYCSIEDGSTELSFDDVELFA